MLSNDGKFVDHFPEVPTAGKIFENIGSVPECIQAYNPDKPDSPAITRRYRATYNPSAGEMTVHYGKAGDKEEEISRAMTHGVKSNVNPDTVKDAVNPDPMTLFAYKVKCKQESVYHSTQTKPLGQIPDQAPNLPQGTDIYESTYGKVMEKSEWAGELINPPKSSKEVAEEAKEGKDLYVKSHASWDPGEQMDRHYDWSRWDPADRFGEPTPSNERGIHMKAAMYWQAQRCMLPPERVISRWDNGAIIDEKLLDDHREKYTDQLGQTRDPIKDTMNVPEDHTFGIIVKPDGFGVDDLLHGRVPKHYLRGKDRERALTAAVRANLKNHNFNRFDDIAAAFMTYDKEGTGRLGVDVIRKMCEDVDIPIEQVVLENILDYCDKDEAGTIDYHQFGNFLNWQSNNQISSNGQKEHYTETGDTPRRIESQIDKQLGGYKTSSSQVNAAVGKVPPQEDYRTYGVPSIRIDRPAPRYKSVSDRTNYGDEADAWGLVTPSVFTNSGVYEEDLFKSRTPQEMKKIFGSIGEQFEEEFFLEVWNHAASLHPKGEVNVECFRSALSKLGRPSSC